MNGHKITLLNLNSCSKNDLINYLESAWIQEDILFKSIIKRDAFYFNPDSLRNPLIFYLGHSAVFYINKLIATGLLNKRIDPEYEALFEMGVDPETPEELQEAIADIKWDSVEKIWEYRNRAYQEIISAIRQNPLQVPISKDDPWWAIAMGIEHQRIHLETSSLLIRQLGVDLVEKPATWHYATSQGNPPPNEAIEVAGGIAKLGKSERDGVYGWDVDCGFKEVEVKPFTVSKYMITNSDFLAFVRAGGYQNRSYWSEGGWQWKERHQVARPLFWRPDNNGYRYRAMFDEMDLPLDFPVEVNHYEASAYCRYLSEQLGQKFSLMTEAQWHLASQKDDLIEDYNLNLKFASPTPVGSLATACSDAGIYDLRGNVWEWLEDTFSPLPGFKPHSLYPDYAAPFFDNQHKMLIGGSWATNGSEATPRYRNWFRPYFYQHAGFRIAANLG